VYAFEPFPQSVAAIRHNAAINQFGHVSVMEAAVSDRSGKGSFITEGTSVQFHLAGAGFRAIAPNAATVPVDVVSIDELVASDQFRPPQLVMIDVEGSEVEVLRGMAHTIERYRPILLCEVHWLVGEFREVCRELLEPVGYVVQRLDQQPMNDQPERYHAVALPR
jgi:FkbM family methyltransferase